VCFNALLISCETWYGSLLFSRLKFYFFVVFILGGLPWMVTGLLWCFVFVFFSLSFQTEEMEMRSAWSEKSECCVEEMR